MQHDYNIADQNGASFRADLNAVLAAIVSNNSGAEEPSPTFAFQWWADTTSGILKQRNASNEAWVSIFDLATGRPFGAMVQTSATGVAILPEGDDSGRPVAPDIPSGALLVRGNTQSVSDYKPEFWDRVSAGWKTFADRAWVSAAIAASRNAIEEWVNNKIGFATIYPNGGSAASPANVAINTRYSIANPFPGSKVDAVAEVFYNSVWGPTEQFCGQASNINFAYGAKASQITQSDTIILQTGLNGLIAPSNLTLSPFNATAIVTTPLPCRIRVTKKDPI